MTVDVFEELVRRYLAAFQADARASDRAAGYWEGRAHEYAIHHDLDKRHAFRVARERFDKEHAGART